MCEILPNHPIEFPCEVSFYCVQAKIDSTLSNIAYETDSFLISEYNTTEKTRENSSLDPEAQKNKDFTSTSKNSFENTELTTINEPTTNEYNNNDEYNTMEDPIKNSTLDPEGQTNIDFGSTSKNSFENTDFTTTHEPTTNEPIKNSTLRLVPQTNNFSSILTNSRTNETATNSSAISTIGVKEESHTYEIIIVLITAVFFFILLFTIICAYRKKSSANEPDIALKQA